MSTSESSDETDSDVPYEIDVPRVVELKENEVDELVL